MNWKALLTGPAALAVLLTLANATKPPVVDDTAYLLFARHLSLHPLDPYGWELFWYRQPEPAMQILLPPVLPYWLAAGIVLFGEQPTFLKFWMFPVCWLLTQSIWRLFTRFAPGWERPGTSLAVLGPSVLPLINFMLDVPAAALGLAAVATFIRGVDNRSTGRVVLAGLLAGLAMQTKYTTFTLPAVFLAYAGFRRGIGQVLLATGFAASVFVAWECVLFVLYNQSHFLAQLSQQPGGSLGERLEAKIALIRPLVVQLGGLAAAWGLLAARAIGVGRWPLVVIAGLLAVGFLAITLIPEANTVLLRNGRTGSVRLDLPSLVYIPSGYAVIAVVAVVGCRMCGSTDGNFLALWVLVELAGYFVLTPFPACRRVVPIVIALSVLVGRAVASLDLRWPIGFGVACGVALLALDAWDAQVEPAGVDAAVARIGDSGSSVVWTQGHWGWQYAADRHGWKLVDPGRTLMTMGNFFVQPIEPDTAGFYRPYHSGAKVMLDPAAVELLGEWVWQDRVAGQTIPNLYGGVYPIVGRNHPRLRVRVYRVIRDWSPASAGTP